MKLDDTIITFIDEIKKELKEEKGIELSEQEIFEIANSQFVGGAFAMMKHISFFFAYIGNFVFKDMKSFHQNVKDISELKGKVSDEEYKQIILEKKIKNRNTMNGSQLKTIDSLQDLPDNVRDSTGMREYNKLYQKVINNE